jgi:hypothetical protein
MLNYLNFLYVFIIGYTPVNTDILVDGPTEIINYNLIYTDLNFKIGFKNFYINGGVKTTTKPLAITNYFPIQDFYTAGCSYYYRFNKKTTFNLSYLHECDHMIAPLMETLPYHKDRAKDEFMLNCTYNNLNIGVGILETGSESYRGKSFYQLYGRLRDSLVIIYNVDEEFCNIKFFKNKIILNASYDIYYKNFYNKISTLNSFGYSHTFGYGIGYTLNSNKAKIDIGTNLILTMLKKIDKFNRASFEDNSKIEAFIKFYN